jgi:hypothetical protein
MSRLDPSAWQPTFDFSGKTYKADRDGERLSAQLRRVFDVMIDGNWRTLKEIGDAAQCPEASASARLRDCRKANFNLGVKVEREFVSRGLHRYRMVRE